MFNSPSIMKRIAIGKGLGLAFGILGFISLLVLAPETGPLLRWGIIFWYTTLGAIIGMFGVFTSHPILKIPLPWWVRSTFLGAWMNFILVFFAYDTMQALLIAIFGEPGQSASPFWFTLEGAFVGIIIGYFATRFGGEGEDLPVAAP